MGSCVSKKAARAGAAREGKVAAPLPPAKEHALSPVVEEEEEVEEVKEVVLSETPAPRSPPEPVKKRQELSEEETEEACSGSECASVGLVAKEKAMAKAKAGGGDEQQEEVVKRAFVEAPEKKAQRARRTAAPDQESKPKPKQNGRARSPSPSSAHRTRPRREPAVVSAFGCRSGRFSPSAARRATESAVRRSHSAREADMSLPAKRCLAASVNGHGALISRRDVGERSGRRSESPTASKRPSPAPSPVHRQAGGATRRAAARDNLSSSTPERSRPRVRDAGPDVGDEQPAALAGGVPGERKKGEEGALGENPSVAMECFIFL